MSQQQQPPPPRKAAVIGTGGGDAFFNDFSQVAPAPTASTSVRHRVGGPPPPQQQQPRPIGGGGSNYPTQQQAGRLPVSAAGRGQQQPPNPRSLPPSKQPQPQQRPITYPQSTSSQPSNSYYGNNNLVSGTTAPMAQPMYEEPQSNDWYTPSANDTSSSMVSGTSNNTYGLVPQPSQQYSQPPPSMMMMSTTTASTPYNPNSSYTNPSSSYFNGAMDTSGRDSTAAASYPIPQTFIPQPQQPSYNVSSSSSSSPAIGDLTDDHYVDHNEPPLLEELGVNWEHIMMKTKAVVIPFRRLQKHSALADPSIIVEDADLAGPLAYALLLGGELLITGKLQFGYIYGFGLFGCLAMTLILNLMSPTSISFWTVTSILGYALIPVNILAAIKIVLFSFGTLVQILALITVVWSTTASTRLLEIGFGLADQRYLIAYPIALLYSAFVLITIF